MKLEKRIDAIVERLTPSLPIERHQSIPVWIAEIETRIGGELPEDFRCFVSRYSFPVLVLGPIEIFANRGDGAYDDITSAPFRDPILLKWFISSRYFQIGRPSSGSYDSVCVKLDHAQSDRVAVERFDHEAILLEEPIVGREQIAMSFLEILVACSYSEI